MKRGNVSNLLIASRPNLSSYLRELLEKDHAVVVATSATEALLEIEKQDFDLILCGTQFEDGGMFEFLAIINVHKNVRRVLVIRSLESPIANTFSKMVSVAVESMGTAKYLDGNLLSVEKLREAIELAIRRETLDSMAAAT